MKVRAVWRRLGGSGSAFHARPPALSQSSLPDDEPPTPTSATPRALSILTTTVSNCSHSFNLFLNHPVAICYTNHPLEPSSHRRDRQKRDSHLHPRPRPPHTDHRQLHSTADSSTQAINPHYPPICACSSAADVLDPATESCAQDEIITMLVAPSRPWLNLCCSSLFRLRP